MTYTELLQGGLEHRGGLVLLATVERGAATEALKLPTQRGGWPWRRAHVG